MRRVLTFGAPAAAPTTSSATGAVVRSVHPGTESHISGTSQSFFTFASDLLASQPVARAAWFAPKSGRSGSPVQPHGHALRRPGDRVREMKLQLTGVRSHHDVAIASK
jgi:hypothetical protein